MFGASKKFVERFVGDAVEGVLRRLDVEQKVRHEADLALRSEQDALRAKLDELTDRLNKVTEGLLGLQNAPTVSADTLATVNELYTEMMERKTKRPAVDLLCQNIDDVRESIKHLCDADSRISNDVINVRESVSEMRHYWMELQKSVAEARLEARETHLSSMRPAPQDGPSEEHLLRVARLKVVELMARLVRSDRAKEEATKAMAFIETGKWPKVPAPKTLSGVAKAPRSRKK